MSLDKAYQCDFHAALVALGPKLHGVAGRLTRNQAAAEDLVQQAVMTAWAKRDLFRPGTNLQAWCSRILFNIFVSEWRRSGGREVLDPDAGVYDVAAPDDPQVRIELDDVRRGLASIPAEQREALLLISAGELSYEEAAAFLGVPIGTVKSRVQRGRRRLLAVLEGGAPPKDAARPSEAYASIIREVARVTKAVQKAASTEEVATRTDPATATVLLVEDEALVRELIHEALADAGLAVTAAVDGAAAMQVLAKRPFDILVTDIHLGPGPDGFEVARYARGLSPAIRVVYVTGHAAHRGAECVHGSWLLSKPFDPQHLAERVRGWFEPVE